MDEAKQDVTLAGSDARFVARIFNELLLGTRNSFHRNVTNNSMMTESAEHAFASTWNALDSVKDVQIG